MKSEELVIQKLQGLFAEHNIFLIEKFRNCARFKSDCVIITIAHDDRENANLVFIGNGTSKFYLGGDALVSIFGTGYIRELKTPELTVDDFLDNTFTVFTGVAKSLLSCDERIFNAFDQYERRKSTEYTNEIIRNQKLRQADQFWEKKDYRSFIKALEGIDAETLPRVYKLRYRIAVVNLEK
ncbi:MAG: hypothetical protein EOO43_13465 [Flavobacterium sp.]|nr:MAG: hypothetical protein EOO43_13465 [Flavobacterium sp.]